MVIIAYFDEAKFAANAYHQLNNNPKVKDISLMSLYDTADLLAAKPSISQDEVAIPEIYTDSVFGALFPGDKDLGQFVFNELGTILVGGKILDQMQILFTSIDSSTKSFNNIINNLNLSEYSDKISNAIENGKILLFISIDNKYQDDISRLLQNHHLLDFDIHQKEISITRN